MILEEKGISYEVEDAVSFVCNLIEDDLQKLPCMPNTPLFYEVKNILNINLFGKAITLDYAFYVTNEQIIFNILKKNYEAFYFNATKLTLCLHKCVLLRNVYDGIHLTANIIPRDRISHEVKHIYQYVKRNSSLLDYKNLTIYQIANEEREKHVKGNHLKYLVAFLIYGLQKHEVTAFMQGDYNNIKNNCTNYKDALAYIEKDSYIVNQLLLPIQEFQNHSFHSIETYLMQTYKRDLKWLEDFVKKGEAYSKRALKRLKELSKKEFIKEEIYINKDWKQI